MRTISIAAAAVLASLSLTAQAALIVGTFSVSGDSIVTDPTYTNPTNITINPLPESGINTSNVTGNFIGLIPNFYFFEGTPSTIGSNPFGLHNQSGGFIDGSLGGLTIASSTLILFTDSGSAGAGGVGVRLSVVLTEALTFLPRTIVSDHYIVGGANALFSTNVSGWDPTPGRMTFSSQQAGSALDNSWSASFSTLAAPAPAPLALIGLGLGLLGVIRRRLHRA